MNKFINRSTGRPGPDRPFPKGEGGRTKTPKPTFVGTAAVATGWGILVSSLALASSLTLALSMALGQGLSSGRGLEALGAGLAAEVFLLPFIIILGGPGALVGIGLILAILVPRARRGGDVKAMGRVGITLGGVLGAANGVLGLWLLSGFHALAIGGCTLFALAGAAGGLAAGIRIARSLRHWRTSP